VHALAELEQAGPFAGLYWRPLYDGLNDVWDAARETLEAGRNERCVHSRQ